VFGRNTGPAAMWAATAALRHDLSASKYEWGLSAERLLQLARQLLH
jgi:hypothetical protein